MAEGSYGSPFYQGNMTPVDGSAPANKFATNMNRKKTRKWVEAKKINYDGSGWGDEDEEEEDDDSGGYGDEPMPPMPSMPLPLPSQTTLAPGVNVGGAHPTAALRARNSPSPSGRVPLNVQTQQPTQPQQQQQSAQQQQQQQQYPPQQLQQQPWRQASPAPGPVAAARASPQLRASSPGTGVGAPSPRSGSQPASGNYTPWREGRSESPLGPRGQSPAGVAPGPGPGPGPGPAGPRTMSPAAAPGGSSGPSGPNGPRGNFIRPSEIYKRSVPSEGSPEAADRGRKEQPVAPATSAIASSNNTAAPLEHPQPQPQHKPQGSVDSTASADDAVNDRRFSTSPKLPDLARFSTFSPELLFGGSGSGFLSSDAPPVPPIPTSPAVGSFSESATTTAKPPALSSVPEGVGSTSRNASPFSTSSGESASAPIRDSAATATTAITSSSLDDTASTAAGARGSADSTPSSVDVPAAAAGGLAAATAAESRKLSSSGVQALSETATAPTAEINTNTNTDANANANANADEAQQKSATSAYSTDPMIAMTAPLNPHRLSSMVPFMPPAVTTPKGPRDMQRTETSASSTVESTPTTTANSPVKESDVLREEIIRTLSPVKMTHSGESLEGAVQKQHEDRIDNDNDNATDNTNAPAQNRSDHTRTLTRESSYLQDVYDDYWTPDDASGNDTYTASDPPPPIPPLASAGAGAASGSGPAPAALAAAVAATAAAAGAAAFASAGHSSSTAGDATPQQQPPAPEPRHTHQLPSQQGLAPTSSAPLAAPVPASSPSPTPSTSGVPGAFPSSNTPTPVAQPAPSSAFGQVPATAAAQAAFSKAPALRRRFSWEAEPEQPADAASGTNAFTAVRASTMAHVPSPPAPGSSQSPPPSLGAMQVSSPVSTVPPPNELQQARTISPHPDTNTVVSAVSTSTVAPELTAPSPVSDAAVAGAGTTSPTAAAAVDGHVGPDSSEPSQAQEAAARPPQAQTQAPVRSMLDVGDAPAPTPIRSMLDVGDDPLPKQLVNRISTAESMQSATSFQSQPQAYPQAQAQAQLSPTAAPSIQVFQPAAAPVSAPTGAPAHNNPALFGSGSEGSGQFLTLRQCMAFGTHHERMAKLTETRREYAAADSGLSSWLQSMTAVPEYARAAYAPLFDNHVGGAGPAPSSSSVSASRPVAAVAATISRVPHVHVGVPSGTQISNKSKEIFSVATGKAGKGLLALRKKGFHKKSAN